MDRDSAMRVRERRKKRRNNTIRITIIIILATILLGSLLYIAKVKYDTKRTTDIHSELKNMMTYGPSDNKLINLGAYPKDYLPKFAGLYDKNMDIAGWLTIDGTKVDLPVVQSADNEYYERKDFNGKYNRYGVPFVDYRVNLRDQSTNTVIYGHNMNDGHIFGELLNYKSLAFYREHPLIKFDSVYGEGLYKIFAIVICKKDDPDFLYHDLIEKSSNDEIIDFVTKARERSLINIPINIKTSDKFLTLSTCDYSFKSETGERIARFVVFARKVRDGESKDVNVNDARINTNPVMPKEWYDMLRQKQEAEIKAQEEAEHRQLIEKWLTEKEKSELTDSEKEKFAMERENKCEYFMSFDELTTYNIYDAIVISNKREADHRKYLAPSEKDLPLSKRLEIIALRKEDVKKYLDEETIKDVKTYKELYKLIEQAKKGLKKYDKWLYKHEQETYNNIQKQQVYEIRLKKAEELGIDHEQYDNWEELSKAIEEAQLQNQDKVNLIIQNQVYLNNDEKTKSYSELEALIAARKQMTKDAGITNIYDYDNWDELLNAISKNNSKSDLIKNNRKFIKSNETSLSYEKLSKLISERKELVNNAKINVNSYNSWEEIEVALKLNEKDVFIKTNRPFIDNNEENKSLTELKTVVEARRKIAEKEGFTSLNTDNWTQTQEYISAKKDENRQKFIKENLGLINSDEYTKSYEELKLLVSSRKELCKTNGVDYNKHNSWNDTNAEIENKNIEQHANAKQKFIDENKAFIDEAEKSLSIEQLNQIVIERKQKVKDANIKDTSIYSSWSETKIEVDRILSEKQKFLDENRAFINEEEKSESFEQLKAIVIERKQKVKDTNIKDTSIYSCWNDTKSAIENLNKPNENTETIPEENKQE